ncbi:DDE-type integrase/transposase/recombinase [Patescibacteria group bacterium]|nr:DDE-type integrase/transposase/recombinase [Patescibacteria group bacterium]
MPYTTNPHMPMVRKEAVKLYRSGWSARQVGRYLGYHHTAIMKWVKRASNDGRMVIPTLSSRPHSHPRALKSEVIQTIIKQRLKHNRCSEVVHQELVNQGINISLSSVKRTLDRHGLIKKKSPWKRMHKYIECPEVVKPGDLVQLDTIHLMEDIKSRIYIYTLIDVFSRWTYARAVARISAGNSLKFVKQAQHQASFDFKYLQSDNGSEFSQHFTERVKIKHRHSRVRKPTDNAYVERFNRTLQEELVDRLPRDIELINKRLKGYLRYYNNERLHLGLDLKTPQQWCQAID